MTDNMFDYLTLNRTKTSARAYEKYKNTTEFLNFFNTLKEIALNSFKWEGLPDTVDELFFEKVLLERGGACFYESPYGILGLYVSGLSDISLYGYPTKGSCMGLNGKKFDCNFYVPGAGFTKDSDRAVICYDNSCGYPYIRYIYSAAARLSDIIRSTDVIAENLKQPLTITAPEQAINTIKQTYKQRKDNEPLIITSKAFDVNNIKVWQNEVSADNLKVMWEHFYNLESYIKEILGVNCCDQQDKRERLLVDEVNANNEATKISIDKRLEQRQKFCKIVNAEFGLNVRVSVNRERSDFDDNNNGTERVQDTGTVEN